MYEIMIIRSQLLKIKLLLFGSMDNNTYLRGVKLTQVEIISVPLKSGPVKY